MKIKKFTFIVLLSATLLQSCEKAPDRMDDFLAEFATVLKQGELYRFELDNGRILIPEEVNNFSGNEGDRVIIYWTPLQGDLIKIKRISPIFKGNVLNEGFPERYENDPLKIKSVWVEGDYLNLLLEIEYHNVPHSIALFRDTNVEGVDLYLAHSRNGDLPGYPQDMYASFSISSLRGQTETSVPFRLFINTHDGIRQFNLILIDTR